MSPLSLIARQSIPHRSPYARVTALCLTYRWGTMISPDEIGAPVCRSMNR
ncbi:hypothetical protein J2129_000778 [Methanofollis sp. W23]|nr:hypothetical protein [Methanofollis sp. W23]